MTARRVAAGGFLVLFAAFGVAAYLGDPLMALLYVLAFAPLALVHAVYLCPRCTNVHCGLNPNSPEFVFRRRKGDPVATGRFSGHRIVWTAAPMSLAGGFAVVGAWRWNPWSLLAFAVGAAFVHRLYLRETCAYCTNACPGNKNPAYRAWKDGRRVD